jgi:small subunit ribosomal protein S3
MAKVNQIRHFVNRNVERNLVREYLLKETERAGFGGLHFERAFDNQAICTKVTLQAERVGMVIGRRGKVINELQRRIQDDFNLENPKLQVEEIDRPALNAQVMASKLASALERGWYFRRAGHSTVLNIVEAGAKGCLIILSGKLTGSRHRTEKFLKGHIKFCGEIAITHMDIGFATAVKKLGTIGCTVAIMKPGAKLPHEVEILSREESGLAPYIEPSPLDEPIVEKELTEGEAAAELEALATLSDEQAASTESDGEAVVEEAAAEEAEATEEAPAAEEAEATEEAPAADEAPVAEEAEASEEAPAADEAPVAEEAPAAEEEAPAEEAPAAEEEAPAEEAAEEAPAAEEALEEAPAEEAPAEAESESSEDESTEESTDESSDEQSEGEAKS